MGAYGANSLIFDPCNARCASAYMCVAQAYTVMCDGTLFIPCHFAFCRGLHRVNDPNDCTCFGKSWDEKKFSMTGMQGKARKGGVYISIVYQATGHHEHQLGIYSIEA